MAVISSNTLAGKTSKIWKLQSALAEQCDAEGNSKTVEITDFSNEHFLAEIGGYAPVEMTFFENRNIKLTYQIEGMQVAADGRWNTDRDNIILEQSTGDQILLLAPQIIDDKTISVGYEFLSLDHGIKKLTFTAS